MLNATDPRFNPQIFSAAFAARCTYLDMAATLSEPHPERPYSEPHVMLGDLQFAAHEQWADAGLLALVGIGVEPGLANVFARYAADELFDELDEVGIRDGANLVVEGYDFAPTFSIWTTIEECLNPPLIWERGRGFYTTEPFSEPEVFEFPEGIGPVECVNVEHEEVVLVPRALDCRRVTFKYGLGREFIDVLRTLHKLGLDSVQPVRVRGVEVAPRDVVAACLPNPATLGDRMRGKTCAGTLVTGTKDGAPRAVYLYHVSDNERTMREYGHQAVVFQTALNPIVALELLVAGSLGRSGRARPRDVPGSAVPRPARRLRRAARDGRGRPAPRPVARGRGSVQQLHTNGSVRGSTSPWWVLEAPPDEVAPAARGNGRRRRRRDRRRSDRALDGPGARGARRLRGRARGGDVRRGRERAQRRLPPRLLVVARPAQGRRRRRRRARDRPSRRRCDRRGPRARRGRLADGGRAAPRLGVARARRAHPRRDRSGRRARRAGRGGPGRAGRASALAGVPYRRALPGRRDGAAGAARACAPARRARLRADPGARARPGARAHAAWRGSRAGGRRRDERLGCAVAGGPAPRRLPERDRAHRARARTSPSASAGSAARACSTRARS